MPEYMSYALIFEEKKNDSLFVVACNKSIFTEQKHV